MSDPDTVTQIGECTHYGSSYNVALYDHYACLANSATGLEILDVQNPDSIRRVDTLRIGSIIGVAVSGHYAYAVGESNLFIVDLSNPEAVSIVGALHGISFAANIAVRDTLAYVVGEEFTVVNIANPAAPVVLGTCPLRSSGWDVCLWRDLAYVAADASGLQVVSINCPTQPVEYGHYNTRGTSRGITAVQNTIYIADEGYFGRYECLDLPAISVSMPNVSYQWATLTAHPISWITAGLEGNVNIRLNRYYPTGDWETILSNIPNNGMVDWMVTGPHAHECRFRVESASDTGVFDVSDANIVINRGRMDLRSQTLAFGSVPVDSSATRTLWIWNTDSDQLEIENIISDDPHFGLPFSWAPLIAPGDSSAVVVRYTSGDTLPHTAHITIYSSAGDSVVTCRVDGWSQNIVPGISDLPHEYRLYPPYPNPFNATATLAFDLPHSGNVRIRVFDMLGRTALVLSDGFRAAGNHRVTLDGSGLAAGIYFARLEAGSFTQSTKLMLLK